MRKIRNRIFIQILIPSTVIFLLVIVGGFVYVTKSFEQQAIRQKSNELQNASRAIHNWLVARISTMIHLSRNPLMEGAELEQILPFLQEERTRLSFIYSEIFYIRPDGRFWNTGGQIGVLTDKGLIRSFTEDQKLFYYHGPMIEDPHFQNSILIAVPVTKGSRLTSILAATIPLPTFKRMIGYFTLEEFDSFMLVNPQSIIIAHSDDAMIGKSERGEYGKVFTANSRYGDYMVFVAVMRTTWKLVGFVSRGLLLEPIRQIYKFVAIFFIAVVLLIGFVSLAISFTVANPIRHLTQHVHQIMEGNYRQKIAVETRDELSELAEAFNSLSDRLVQMRTDDRFVFLGHVSARMAHEIRKPLHIIQLATQSMKSRKEYSEKHLDLIHSEIENADRFIGEILNFARPERLNLTRYSLPSLMQKIFKKYQLVAEQKGITITQEIDSGIPPFYMDIMRIEEVLSNLIENALESMDQQNGKGEISILLRRESRQAIDLVISDSGPGFDEELIDKLFDPYFTTKENGTGLGLSICYRILSAHGARISLENTEDHHGKVIIRFRL